MPTIDFRQLIIDNIVTNEREKAIYNLLSERKVSLPATIIAKELNIGRNTVLYILHKLNKWKIVELVYCGRRDFSWRILRF